MCVLCLIMSFNYIIPQNGVTMTINGVPVTLRVISIVFLADTLAAHQLGGFKIGVGWSFQKCRDCLATRRDIQSKVLECCTVNAELLLSTICSFLKKNLL